MGCCHHCWVAANHLNLVVASRLSLSADNVFSFDDEPLPSTEELKEAIVEAEEEHTQAVSSLDLSYDVLMPNANFKVCSGGVCMDWPWSVLSLKDYFVSVHIPSFFNCVP